MRVAIFSDVHANYTALAAVLADIERRGADALVCLGDIVLKGPQPKESVDRIRSMAIPAVLGNCDASFGGEFDVTAYKPQNKTQEYLLEDYERCLAVLSADDVAWLSSRPILKTQVVEGQRLDLFHSTPRHIYELVWPWDSEEKLVTQIPEADTAVAVYGHIHRAFVRWVPGGKIVVNAGSVGLPFDGDPRASYLMLELGPDGASPQIIRVAYDYEQAVRIAQQANWPGAELFAYTVRTGRFAG